MTIPSSLYEALRDAAAKAPDADFLRVSGEEFTIAEVLERVEATARGLRSLGVQPGERVGVMCQNRPETVWAWLGSNAARLIDVPFNAEVRGRLLDYIVGDAAPRVLVGTLDHLHILAETITVDPAYVVVVGEAEDGTPFGDRAQHLSFDALLAAGRASEEDLPLPRAGEIATIMYTSGTTGPPKGVMLPQRYYSANAAHAREALGLREDDVYYLVQPLFHIDARSYVSAGICVGGIVSLGRRFSVSRFWEEVRAQGATVFGMVGTMLWLLHKREARPDDADNSARVAICSSTPKEIHEDFERRFGVKIIESYGMTECLLIASVPAEETRPGSIGKVLPELYALVVDDEDAEVPAGATGELIFRPHDQFAMMQGYWAKPEATVETWRNLWFHTGDLVRRDEDGWIEYIGRRKDAIRRRGENVSAWEVEQAVVAHPAVLEAAAIGVASEVGEEDVAVLLVLAAGADLDPAQLLTFLAADLPRFAIPRYVEVVDSFPKTPSERVEKAKVRERGLSGAAWDANVELGRR